MKKLCTLFVFLVMLTMGVSAQKGVPFSNETLKYMIQYKWGLVQKNGATATITLRNNPNSYSIRLTASTLPWADRIYPMRDTLTSNISKQTFKPINYTKITHENGRYRKDVINYSYVDNHAYADVTRVKSKAGQTPTTTHKRFSATGPTYDMVSIFYFVRALNFDKLTGGKIVKANIFSGSGVENIKIKNLGKQTVSVPGGSKKYSCFHLQLTFTTESGKVSSQPLDVWVTADASHTPVKMVGTLPIGQVRCFLVSGL